jgi:tripartite-type tricarboxylate transporter receptor subunit TctC
LLSSPLALAVNPSLGVNTLAEFIALARTRAAAGKPLSYGSAGPGTVIHFPMAMLAHRNGVQMTHVPYKGLAPVFTDLAAGHIDAAWMAVSGATPFVKEGKFKALVVGAPARARSLPDVPVFKETGIAPIQADFVFTLVAPAGTPKDITEKIAADIRKIIMDPAFRAEFADPFGYVMYGSTPADLAQYLEKDRAAQAERVRVSGVKLD